MGGVVLALSEPNMRVVRVCRPPHCNATLPFKQHAANSPKGAAAKNAAAAAAKR